MGKQCDLSSETVAEVRALMRAGGMSMRVISRQCNISVASVSNVKNRIQKGILTPQRAGKCKGMKKTTQKEDRMLVRNLKNHLLASASQLKTEWEAQGVSVSTRTVQRRLVQLGCKSVIPRTVPKLTNAMMRKRLQFAKQYLGWTVNDWRRVCFSDESTFECQTASKQRVWQPLNFPRPLRQKVKHPVKIMVWGIISVLGAGRLHVCEGNMNAVQYINVMQNCALPQMREWFPDGNFVFMQDKAPCHTARTVKAVFLAENVQLLEWPGNSPDLNPIENIWGLVKKKIRQETITTKQQAIAAVIKYWYMDATLRDIVVNAVESMPRRIAAVIAAKGGHTNY